MAFLWENLKIHFSENKILHLYHMDAAWRYVFPKEKGKCRTFWQEESAFPWLWEQGKLTKCWISKTFLDSLRGKYGFYLYGNGKEHTATLSRLNFQGQKGWERHAKEITALHRHCSFHTFLICATRCAGDISLRFWSSFILWLGFLGPQSLQLQGH